jgi:hypothetical protein
LPRVGGCLHVCAAVRVLLRRVPSFQSRARGGGGGGGGGRSACARALVQLSTGSEAHKNMIAGGGGAEFLLKTLTVHSGSSSVVRDICALVRAVTTDDDMVAVMSKARGGCARAASTSSGWVCCSAGARRRARVCEPRRGPRAAAHARAPPHTAGGGRGHPRDVSDAHGARNCGGRVRNAAEHRRE